MKGQDIANIIYNRIKEDKFQLISNSEKSKEAISYFYKDNLLPKKIALQIRNVFLKKEICI
tara:strand:- start:31950 stop:32132 length:183 start_codon:yes stop_codon:yes gene_type:complete